MKMKKILALALAAVLLVAVGVGGTLAWLTATTDEVTNTFIAAGLTLELEETPNDEEDIDNDGITDEWVMQLIPGTAEEKDPTVTVTTSVEAYVFVKFDCTYAEEGEKIWFNFRLNDADYSDDYECTWELVDGEEDVWYTTVSAAEGAQTATYVWELLEENADGKMVVVSDAATGTDVAEGFNMTFDAWAIQTEGFATAKLAWDELN